MTTSNQKTSHGFTAIEAVIIVLVVGLIGVLGWRFWSVTHQPKTATSSVVTSASTITNADDLQKTDTALKNLDVDDGTVNSLDQQTSY